MVSRSELERIASLEQQCKDAEADCAQHPDFGNLVKLGGTLLLLQQFLPHGDPRKRAAIVDAISNLEKVVVLNPKVALTWWDLGRAQLCLSLFFPDIERAEVFFATAKHYFTLAHEAEPENPLYLFSVKYDGTRLIHAKRFQNREAAALASSSSCVTTGLECKSRDLEL